MVGTSGSTELRRARLTPMARSRPTLMWSMADGIVAKRSEGSPPTSDITAGPPPLYGTCTIFVPVWFMNFAVARWLALALPAEAKWTYPAALVVAYFCSMALEVNP